MNENVSYPDYIGVTDVTAETFEHMRVEAYMDGQTSVMMDEPQGFDIGDPPDLMGQSRGWTPVHCQLAGLTGCTTVSIAVAAREIGFKYETVRTKVRSLIDIRGFMADFDRQPEFKQVNFDLFVTTDEPDAKFMALAKETDKRCPQIILFHQAKIPMVVSWYRAGSEKPAFVQRFFIEEDQPTPEETLLQEGSGAAPAD